MSRYVDAEKMPSGPNWDALDDKEKATVLSFLIKLPTADVEEVRHGMWVEYKCPRHDPHGLKVCMCTACEEGWDKEDLMRAGKGCLPKRCPKCGAHMTKEKEK